MPGTIAIGTAHAAGVAPSDRFIGPGGAGLIIQNSIAVTNSGEVLAVWAERTGDANIACGNQGVVSGAWGSSAALSQVANLAVDPTDTGLPLRVNASGAGVLGWTEQLAADRKSRILRYTPGSGWATNAIDLLAPVGPLFGQAGSSDLQLLDDGRIEFSELVGVGTSDRASAVYRQDGSGAPTVFIDLFMDFGTSSSDTASNGVSIAADPQGNTITISMLGGDLKGLGRNSAGEFRASFFSTVSVPACTYGVSTSTAAYTRPAYVAVSSARFSVFSVTTKDPSTPQCFLKLWTFDPGDRQVQLLPITTTPTTPGTYLFQPPVLAMDQAGNGVAVWQQWSGDPNAPTIVPVWARSTAGLAWGSPEILGSNGSTIGVPEQSVPIRFALNRSGQGVAAMVVRRDGTPYIATARYSGAAWSDWSLAASAPMFSIPNVAINEAADAFLIYAAQSCTRSGTPPVPGSCGDTQKIYVLKLQP